MFSCLVASAAAFSFPNGIIDPGAEMIEGSDISRSSRNRSRGQGADEMRLGVHVLGVVPPALKSLDSYQLVSI